jgi:polyisoprenoid-binding protein YceI
MSKGFRKEIIAIIAVVLILVLGIVGYIYVSGGSGEASEPISAPTLVIPATTVPEESAITPEAPVEEPADTTEAAAPETEVSASDNAAADLVLFRISQADSQASFSIDEVLRGVPTTVLGVTDQVAGDMIVNFAAPALSEVGMIRVNARTLTTDNDFRNRAIRSSILQSASADYEFVEFTPTGVSGLPQSAASIGDTLTFQVTGDLKIRDIVNSVTFDVTVTLASAERLEGNATTTVMRGDYQLSIPSAPGVADVSEEVIISIDFVALATDS